MSPKIKVTRAHYDEGLASWFLARAEAYRRALNIAKAGGASAAAVKTIAVLMASNAYDAFIQAKSNAEIYCPTS